MIGAGGFSKTLTAYVIYFAATRVNLENPLLRIPVLAAASGLVLPVHEDVLAQDRYLLYSCVSRPEEVLVALRSPASTCSESAADAVNDVAYWKT